VSAGDATEGVVGRGSASNFSLNSDGLAGFLDDLTGLFDGEISRGKGAGPGERI
jgi:hypothetical protein